MSLLVELAFARSSGDEEDRTPDPLRARQVLSQLSYTPVISGLRFILLCFFKDATSFCLFSTLKIEQLSNFFLDFFSLSS